MTEMWFQTLKLIKKKSTFVVKRRLFGGSNITKSKYSFDREHISPHTASLLLHKV